MLATSLSTQFLANPFVDTLKTIHRFIYLRLCMRRETSCLGIVSLSRKRIAFDTDTTVATVNKCITALVNAGKAVEDGQNILLVDFIAMSVGYENALIDSSGMKERLLSAYKACKSPLLQHALQQRYPLLFSQDMLAAYSLPLPQRSCACKKNVASDAQPPLPVEAALANSLDIEEEADAECVVDEKLEQQFARMMENVYSQVQQDDEQDAMDVPDKTAITHQRALPARSMRRSKRAKKNRIKKARRRR